MTEQNAFEATREYVAVALEAAADAIVAIEIADDLSPTERSDIGRALRRLANALDRKDSPSASTH